MGRDQGRNPSGTPPVVAHPSRGVQGFGGSRPGGDMAYRTRKNVARAIGERGAGDRVFRVLALDGGGMRGLIPAQVLAYLERRARRPVHELFDLVAGTSTGGLLSLALTIPRPEASEPYTAEGAIELYRE